MDTKLDLRCGRDESRTAELAAAFPPGAVDRTPPNYGLVIVFELPGGAAFRCVACGSGTAAGAYPLDATRLVARQHRDGSCPRADWHHITRTWIGHDSREELCLPRRRHQTRFSGTASAWAGCSCSWVGTVGSADRAAAQTLARRHRDDAHAASLA